MAVVTRRNVTKQYVPRCDRKLPVDQQTRFIIRAVSRRAMSKIKDGVLKVDLAGGEPVVMTETFKARVLACRHGIVGWENLKYDDGEPVQFTAVKEDDEDVVSESSLDDIMPFIDELGQAVIEFNQLTEADLGNSPRSPRSSPADPANEPSSPSNSNARNAEDGRQDPAPSSAAGVEAEESSEGRGSAAV